MTLEEELELAELVASSRRVWPTFDLAPTAFAAYVMARRPPDLPTLAWLTVVHRDCLYLAAACVAGCPTALTAFRAIHGAELDPMMLDALFTGPSPKLATYSGRAPLRRWLRQVGERLSEGTPAPVADDITRARVRDEYRRAFGEVLAELDQRDRAVLAQYHVDRLTVDELGALYGVHRATASRWILSAEDVLRGRMLARLCDRLSLTPSDAVDVARLVRDQLPLSLARLA
jgi:RNA polymerase sigma-70 factor (ECF subfamily)